MKKMIAVCLSAALVLSMTACGAASKDAVQSNSQSVVQSLPSNVDFGTPISMSGEPAPSKPASSAASQAPAQTDAFPVTVKDALDRTVKIEKQPQKIVSGYYITSSLLIALGLEKQVVGIEAKAKTRPIYALAAPEFLELPNVGSAKEFDLEGCAALKPDLVILPIKLKDSVKALEELGITVIAVNPEGTEQLQQMIETIAIATGTTETGTGLIRFSMNQTQKLTDLLADAKKPTVYLGGNSAFLSTAGAKMYQNALIETAGGKNVAAELKDNYWADVSYEQVIAWNPDVIVLASDAQYTVQDVLNDKNISSVTAVKNKAVYQMPGAYEAWDSPVPSSALGSLWLASVLHSDVYTPEMFTKEATAFYHDYYDIAYQAPQKAA
ncbi:MAG: ABC transporter substrate-binding protein [Ruthenibacterium sp.]